MKRFKISENSWYDIGFLPDNLKVNNFEEMWNLHPETRGKVIIYGQERTIPRFQQAYLRNYVFSGVESKALPLPDIFRPYLEFMNTQYEGEFNQLLVNWYPDASSYIGQHSDDETQLISDSPIVTISLGQERKFRIRNKEKKIVKDILTKDGMILVMGGKFQKEFKHEIVKITGKKAETIGRRISITLRQFKL